MKEEKQTERMDSGEAKLLKMTTEPVEKLILRLAVPTIISMLVTAFYNLADTFFVKQLGNDHAVAGVGVVLSLQTVIQAFGYFCGHGSGNYISRAFGRKDYANAEKMAATGFVYALLFGGLVMLIGLPFREPLALLLGSSTPLITESAVQYMTYILLATPLMTGAIVMNNQLRLQGNAFFAMIGLTSGALLNVILDPIFIYRAGDPLIAGYLKMPFGLGMGVGGAALATAISQAVSFVLLFIGMQKSDNVKIRLRNFSPKFYFVKKIVQGGLPSLARQGLASLATACLNHSVGMYILTETEIAAVQAAMTGSAKIMNFASSALIGFGQGFQPVCGFNYGAKRYDRVSKAFWFCVKFSAGFIVAAAALIFLFAESITGTLVSASVLSSEIAAFTLRAQILIFPLMAYVMPMNMMLQTIGDTVKATVIAMARQGLTFIPAVLLLPQLCAMLGFEPLLGIELAQALADIAAFALALPIGLCVLRRMKQEYLGMTEEEKKIHEH